MMNLIAALFQHKEKQILVELYILERHAKLWRCIFLKIIKILLKET
jgi:hypothetical protein